jgi:hypothetical protein
MKQEGQRPLLIIYIKKNSQSIKEKYQETKKDIKKIAIT